MTPPSLRALAEACADAAVAEDGSPLPAAYRRDTLPVWEGRLAAELSLLGALASLEVRTVELDPAELIDVNSPDDLRVSGEQYDRFMGATFPRSVRRWPTRPVCARVSAPSTSAAARAA